MTRGHGPHGKVDCGLKEAQFRPASPYHGLARHKVPRAQRSLIAMIAVPLVRLGIVLSSIISHLQPSLAQPSPLPSSLLGCWNRVGISHNLTFTSFSLCLLHDLACYHFADTQSFFFLFLFLFLFLILTTILSSSQLAIILLVAVSFIFLMVRRTIALYDCTYILCSGVGTCRR